MTPCIGDYLKRFMMEEWVARRIDSAHVFSTGQDTSFNALDLYFDKLRLINLDFASLYHAEKIKVDTVYCLNPSVTMKLDITRKKATQATEDEDTIYFHGTHEVKKNWNKKAKGTRGDEKIGRAHV